MAGIFWSHFPDQSSHACRAPTVWPPLPPSLSSWHSSPYIFFIFTHSKYFSVFQKYHALQPLGLHMLFFPPRTFFLLPPSLMNSCPPPLFQVCNSEHFLLDAPLNAPILAKVPTLSHGLCPTVPSEQESSCVIIALVIVSALDGQFYEDRSTSSSVEIAAPVPSTVLDAERCSKFC